ncbi:MAG TPA: hypothetical protein DCY61_05120 [Dehalococcoidia bacterium]|nr:hypothetical protein [Dehalococcoidia bacterium]
MKVTCNYRGSAVQGFKVQRLGSPQLGTANGETARAFMILLKYAIEVQGFKVQRLGSPQPGTVNREPDNLVTNYEA